MDLDTVPLIINITHGSNTRSDVDLIKISSTIKNIKFKDGGPLIANILIPTHYCFEEIKFPSKDKFYELLDGRWEYIEEISSKIPNWMQESFMTNGYCDIADNKKLIWVNPEVREIENLYNIMFSPSRPGPGYYDIR